MSVLFWSVRKTDNKMAHLMLTSDWRITLRLAHQIADIGVNCDEIVCKTVKNCENMWKSVESR